MIDFIAYLTGLPVETVQAAVGGYILRLLGAVTSVVMLGLCMLAGAKVMRIELRKSIDRVEDSPVAFAVLVVGHFLGAALIIAYAMG
jgi:hypothetical protein